MSELKPLPCPFCGSEAEYYGECDMVWVRCSNHDCNAERINKFDEPEDAVEDWNRRAQPANEPLTLEELRGMDGEPVYIVAYPDWGHWELSEDAEDYFEGRDEDFYGMIMPPSLPDPMGKYGLHMLGWLAYRRKPEPEGGDR